MARVVWLYLIPLVIAVLVVSTLRKGRLGINLQPVHCSSCKTPMSARRRRPISVSQLMFGGWVCPHCGTEMDKWGKNVSHTAPSGKA
jgi:hypothetical protein